MTQLCYECGATLLDPVRCPECLGDDSIGVPFCPNCDYCCGC